MHELWQALVACVGLVLAYVIPRSVLGPESHPWQVWSPAALATALLSAGVIARYWLWVFVFGLMLPIEIWRTFPTWRALRLGADKSRRA